MKKIKENVQSNFYIGSLIKLNVRDGFYRNWDQSHLYWTTFLGTGLKVKYDESIFSKSNIYISSEIPIIGMASRPQEYRYYKVENPSFFNLIKINSSNPDFVTIVKYFNPKIDAGFTYNRQKKTSLTYFYHFEYLSALIPYSRLYIEVQQGIGIKLNL